MENFNALLISVIYVFAILIAVTVFDQFSKKPGELSRKLIHILVGNWVFISLMFTNICALLLIPGVFIILNFLSLKFNLVKAMERNDDSLGTIYYALSMFFLAAVGFALKCPVVPVTGMLIMAYGDGLAAITGLKWGKWHPFAFAPAKTFVGSATVALVGFLVTLAALLFYDNRPLDLAALAPALIAALINGLWGCFIELKATKGFDNLSLPIGTGLFAGLSLYFYSWWFWLGSAGALIIFIGLSFKKTSSQTRRG